MSFRKILFLTTQNYVKKIFSKSSIVFKIMSALLNGSFVHPIYDSVL